MEECEKGLLGDLDAFLKEQNKIELSGDMRHLLHYRFEKGLQMLEAKQRFISFLLTLQNMSLVDFHLLDSHTKFGEEYIYLLYEFVLGNPVFSEKELKYCPKLRDPSFIATLRDLKRDGLMGKYYAIFYVVAFYITKRGL